MIKIHTILVKLYLSGSRNYSGPFVCFSEAFALKEC